MAGATYLARRPIIGIPNAVFRTDRRRHVPVRFSTILFARRRYWGPSTTCFARAENLSQPSRLFSVSKFQGLHVQSPTDVAAIRETMMQKVWEIRKRVALAVNHDPFRLDGEVGRKYVDMVRNMNGAHHTRVSRYITFMRLKLGRELTPHIFESEAQALHSKV